jgi:hypothetical protein
VNSDPTARDAYLSSKPMSVVLEDVNHQRNDDLQNIKDSWCVNLLSAELWRSIGKNWRSSAVSIELRLVGFDRLHVLILNPTFYTWSN